MKNKIIIVFLFSVLIPIHFTFAFGEFDLGGKYNPINIQVQPDPSEQMRQQNLSLQSQLKTQYGYSIYSSCKSSVCGSYDASDPFSESSCLIQLESWLGQSRCLAQRQQANENSQCDTGFVKTLSNGWYVCNPATPVKTNVPVSSSGGSVIQSTLTCNGKIWTDCPIGQKFYCPSTGDAQCVPIPKTATEVTTPVTKKVPEIKAETKVITPVIKTTPEIKADTTSTPNLTTTNSDVKVVPSAEPVKPKSLWARFIGWLGF